MSDSSPPSAPIGVTEGHPAEPQPIPAKRVRSWALWDWATQPFNSVILTFVFAPLYLVSTSFLAPHIADLPEDAPERVRGLAELSSRYGAWTAIAGLLIFYLAPVLGSRSETSGGRKRWLVAATGGLALVQFLLAFVQEDPRYFTYGAILLALGSVVSEIAGVNYNAMLHQVSTPATVGRVSGLGWGMGYLGGIVALVIVVVLNAVHWFGMDTANGMVYRLIAVGAAVWTIVFSIPLVLNVPEYRKQAEARRGFFSGYVDLVADMIALYKQSRPTFWFLFASAVYRDGLAGVFAFGGVLAAAGFGFSSDQVIIFGIAANVVAGASTIFVGRIDDRVGARKVIVVALSVLVAMAVFVFVAAPLGDVVFWVGGLTLSACVGPAQASSRALLSKVTPEAMQGEVFGLYATTGRVASPLSPALWAAFIAWFGATRYGVLGIAIVLALGLVLLLLVKIDSRQVADHALEPLTGWNRNAIAALTIALFLGVGGVVLLLTGAHDLPAGAYVTAGLLLLAGLAVVPGHKALAAVGTSGEEGGAAARAAVTIGYVALATAAVVALAAIF
ncbi:MFS transporter [Xylanimonas sp. McL0601]|uniref:MFS transporter n=1 Tax=Xylanimonas sp. McL0601 TaxID=3414739 RepID=UPI003CF3C581